MTTQTTISTIQKEVERLANFKGNKANVYPYIINCIDFEGYDIKQPETVAELLQALFDTFVSEKIKHHKNWSQYYGGIQKAFTDWLQGLPSSFKIDFEYYEILKLADKWGQISPSLTGKRLEQREDKLCETWFPFITSNCFQLFAKYGVNTSITN